MKKLAAILMLLVTAPGCAAKYGENWRPVSEAGLEVMFPGEPAREAHAGQMVFTLRQGDETFDATYVLAGPTTPDLERFFDQLRGLFLKRFGTAALLDERAVNAGGLKGREITVDALSGGRIFVARFYATKSITYSAFVSRPKGRPLSDDAKKFLESVEIESSRAEAER